MYNVMLPRTYYPEWQGNLHERRCRAIANQLQGGDMDIDFDQVSDHAETLIYPKIWLWSCTRANTASSACAAMQTRVAFSCIYKPALMLSSEHTLRAQKLHAGIQTRCLLGVYAPATFGRATLKQ